VDEPTGFDKNRGAIFGRRGPAAAVRSEAEDERPSPAASNPTLSATPLRCQAAALCSSRAACQTSRAASAFIAAMPSPTTRSGQAECV
jgi:hypothetical protein